MNKDDQDTCQAGKPVAAVITQHSGYSRENCLRQPGCCYHAAGLSARLLKDRLTKIALPGDTLFPTKVRDRLLFLPHRWGEGEPAGLASALFSKDLPLCLRVAPKKRNHWVTPDFQERLHTLPLE